MQVGVGCMERTSKIVSCVGCVYLKTFNDWKDGDYQYCDHPNSTARERYSDRRAIIRYQTPEWCPLNEAKDA